MSEGLDEIILGELLKSLGIAKDVGPPKIRFDGVDYTPARLIEHVENRTQIGIDYYNLFAKYREIARKFKSR